ncbi:acyl-ACP--UDP-N-acetylglucosamine O-acyltransferase [Chamaesiphon sp. VAR_69_metabat_338]|uniref:acyl-ACP--UDP-N-acetylglucosamine O-acyltransferase n=1 Tax=Chamaesiphon sp. VAR_69_metabat_338 TaxID=2964704 RepID=UPI00286E9867|nr:acyl-ACP--UDP-N-acetylglucosamine O-acyltransferase [Chamaesiphon sp. VAR_69_metabat_338]
MQIHPTAAIEPGAKIGQNVTIGPFCYIRHDVEIGDNCILDAHVTLLPYTSIGQNCHLHSNVVIGDLPQDLAFKDEPSYVQIGDNCSIREGVTIHRGTKAGTATIVGNNCLLMAYSHLAHNVRLGNDIIVANGALLAGYVEVGDRAFISGNCLVHQFVRIGRLVMMAGGSAAQKDIPPFCMTRSTTLNKVMGLNTVGLRRAGLTAADRLTLKRAFKILYQSNLLIPEALAKLEAEFDTELVREICDFIKHSQRGIASYVRQRQREE